MRRPLALLAVSAFVAACAAPDASVSGGASPAAQRTVEVVATYRQRIMLTPGHVLTVRLEDVSLADAPARVLAETRQDVGGRAPPYAARLGVDAAAIDPRHDYAVRAEIRDATGRLRFTTDMRHAVLTRGAGDTASITLVMTP